MSLSLGFTQSNGTCGRGGVHCRSGANRGSGRARPYPAMAGIFVIRTRRNPRGAPGGFSVNRVLQATRPNCARRLRRDRLVERIATGAGVLRVGVVDREALLLDGVDEVDDGAVQV